MSDKPSINGKEIVSDIRWGMTDKQLMDKYKVSCEKLHNILKLLLDAHVIERSALEPLVSVPHERLDTGTRRRLHRGYVFIKLPIYDLEDLLNKGIVVDISETGLQISGIPTRFGDTKEFLVQSDYFADVLPFVIEARCRWVSRAEGGKFFSGFEITSITKQASEELKKLTRMLAIGG